MASAGPYASLHLAPDKRPHKPPTTLFFTGRMPFLLPYQQRQSTEGKYYVECNFFLHCHPCNETWYRAKNALPALFYVECVSLLADWTSAAVLVSSCRVIYDLCRTVDCLQCLLWHCRLGIRKSIRPVKNICLDRGADVCIWPSWCHCIKNPIVSGLIKKQTGFPFLVLAYPGCPGKEAIKCVQ